MRLIDIVCDRMVEFGLATRVVVVCDVQGRGKLRLVAIIRGIVGVQVLGLHIIVVPCTIDVDMRNVKHVMVWVLFHVSLLSRSLIATCCERASNFLLKRCLA